MNWYKTAQIEDGYGRGMHYQQFGHDMDRTQILFWIDTNGRVQQQSSNKGLSEQGDYNNALHDDLEESGQMPSDTLFSGRFDPEKRIVTIMNRMQSPMLDRYIPRAEKAIRSSFGDDVKIYGFWQ